MFGKEFLFIIKSTKKTIFYTLMIQSPQRDFNAFRSVPFHSVPSVVPSPSISFGPSLRAWTYRSVHRSVPEHIVPSIVPSLDISFRPRAYRSIPRSVPGHIVPSPDISFRPGRILLINLELYELELKI